MRFVYVCTYTRVLTYTRVYNVRRVTLHLTFSPTSHGLCIMYYIYFYIHILRATKTFLLTFAFFPHLCESWSLRFSVQIIVWGDRMYCRMNFCRRPNPIGWVSNNIICGFVFALYLSTSERNFEILQFLLYIFRFLK